MLIHKITLVSDISKDVSLQLGDTLYNFEKLLIQSYKKKFCFLSVLNAKL